MPVPEPNDTAAEPSVADQALIGAAKRALRAAVRLRRASRPAARRAANDHARTARLLDFLDSRTNLTVAAYLSGEEEPGTLEFVAWCAAHDIPVLLPVQRGESPDWASYAGPDSLQLGPHGIAEPAGLPLGAATLAAVDVVVLPGLAGNEHGARLGRGGGWYDRALAGVAGPVRVLLLNDDEVMAAIPTEVTDQPVDVIITETRTIACQ